MVNPIINRAAIKATQAAIALLKQPGNWTQNTNAANEFGNSVPPSASSAVCWCLNGAVSKNIAGRYGDPSYIYIHDRIWDALEAAGFADPVGFNDKLGRTQEEVVTVLELALGELEKAA